MEKCKSKNEASVSEVLALLSWSSERYMWLTILSNIYIIYVWNNIQISGRIDVPRPLINDLWVFLFQKIDTECVKWASRAGTSAYVKAFIINVNKCLKPFFLEQHKNIAKRVTLQCFWFIFSVKSVNNISLLIIRKRHHKVPLITKWG